MDDMVELRCKYCGAPLDRKDIESDSPYITCPSCGTTQQRLDARKYMEQMMGQIQSWIAKTIPGGFAMGSVDNVDPVARHSIYVNSVKPRVDVEINEKDLKIDYYRSSGAGGQHVNKTESAVRITHIPTGIVVECQNERSQIKNRESAMQVLKARLYDHYRSLQESEYAQNRRMQVGTGDRSERIRTYNYPQGRVTDHRIGMTLYSLDAFLDGDIGEMIEALREADMAERLKSEN